jgi:hypothetical protein
MNIVTVPLILAKTLVEVALGTAAAFSFSRSGS